MSSGQGVLHGRVRGEPGVLGDTLSVDGRLHPPSGWDAQGQLLELGRAGEGGEGAMGWGHCPSMMSVVLVGAVFCSAGRSACRLQQLRSTSQCDQWWRGSHGHVFLCRDRVRVVEGEVLPIYHAVLFDPCVVESPTPSQAYLTPKHDVVLSVLRPASCEIPPALFKL